MSLINDALKRARLVQQQTPPPTPPLQFRRVELVPTNPTSTPLVLICLALAVMVAVALGGTVVGLVARKSARELPVTTRAVTEQAVASPAAALIQAVGPPSPALPPARAPALTPVELETNTLTPVAVVEPLKPLAPKLQGISFHPTRPSAIVNGKSVVVGDRVDGFRVLAIASGSVILGNGTATKVLSLSE